MLGEKKVDELHAYFEALLPDRSSKYKDYYGKAWNPANYGGHEDEISALAVNKTGSFVKASHFVRNEGKK